MPADDLPAEKVRRIYGKGFGDGVRAMKESIATDKIRSLRGTESKVMNAVPISEPWNTNRIVSEVRRIGHGVDHRAVEGALNHLVSIGLVKEPTRGMFIREHVKQETKDETKTVVTSIQKPKENKLEPDDKSPLDRLAGMVSELRGMSAAIGAFAARLEDCAIDCQAEIDASSGKNEKLRQLQELLKSL